MRWMAPLQRHRNVLNHDSDGPTVKPILAFAERPLLGLLRLRLKDEGGDTLGRHPLRPFEARLLISHGAFPPFSAHASVNALRKCCLSPGGILEIVAYPHCAMTW